MKKLKLTLLSAVMFIAQHAFAQTYNPAPYCGFRNFSASVGATPDYISGLQLNSINKSMPAPDSGYVYYSGTAATSFTAGSSYPLTIEYQKPDAEYMVISVFIDYDHNNVFDHGDLAFNKNGIITQSFTSTFTLNGNITIPATALAGTTRMRVMIMDVSDTAASVTADPCAWSVFPSGGIPNYGEAIDLNVNIVKGGAGVAELQNSTTLTLFPNPASNTISISKELIGSDVTIINAVGELQMERTNIQNNELDIRSLSQGIFIVRVVSPSGNIYISRLSVAK